MLTDYGLALLCALYARRLWKVGADSGQLSVANWALGMACLAAASLAGGTFHGFSNSLAQSILRSLWKITVYTIGLASFFWFAGALCASVTGTVRRWFMIVPWLQLAVFSWWMTIHDEFLFVIYDYGSMSVGVLVLQLYGWYKFQDRSAPWLITGVLISVLAAVVQAAGLSFHRHFNHNDLYHVIQMGGMVVFCRGARLLKDR